MVLLQKLTAQTLLEAPRRGNAVPNHNGVVALYTVSTHKFEYPHETAKEIWMVEMKTGESLRILRDEVIQDAVWIPGTTDVMFLRPGDGGRTQAVVIRGSDAPKDPVVVAEFNAPVQNLKLKRLDDGSIVFMVSGQVDCFGRLFNEENTTRTSTARIFDSARVRTWNVLASDQPYSLWYSTLRQDESGNWKFQGHLHNLVKDRKLDVPAGRVEGQDPLNYFDISHRGVAFIAERREVLDPGESFVRSAYFVPLDTFTLPPTGKPKSISLPSSGPPHSSLMSNIRFSPDGSSIAFLHVRRGDEYDSRLFLASTNSLDAFDVFSLVIQTWDDGLEAHDPPQSFEFAGNSENIIMTSFKYGRTVLSTLTLREGEKPVTIFGEGTVSAYYPVKAGGWDELLVSSSNFIDSRLWQVVSVPHRGVVRTISPAAARGGPKFGLSRDMVSEFWYEGADGVFVHSFMIRPSNFDERKTYPWVLIPHGGPVAAWGDAWSTRWNPAAWAEQGYIVILPNITGSVGYGLEFAQRVYGEWGGRPFQDLLNLIDYLETLRFLDQSKAVLAGASYSAYMVSWMMGHEIIKKFCCSIWHDGIFNLPSFVLQTDAIYEGGNFEGALYPWQRPKAFERFNPAQPHRLRKWANAPPTLVIHSEKDYRSPITEGIAVFNTLKSLRVPSRFLTFSDEGHWVLDPTNSLAWHETVWDWMRRCVDGEIKRGDTNW
ncbi:hypothetical protein QQS21_003767 [Conoideocrella luteorostrata]|uniref:Dipeptidyl-peptidase V n=1 Tax=Conoideocrella luteorostrata TaxID=1105319 RepID=A0AAJ0CTL0_9HYPO|nr:hypothetical protein QQS21_003767 [Conoideocrella luteorostrata]